MTILFKAFVLGVLPSELSMHVYAGLLTHFMSGAHYPLGGSSEIAYQIIRNIERYGGKVLVDAPVSNILINESGRAYGKIISHMTNVVKEKKKKKRIKYLLSVFI